MADSHFALADGTSVGPSSPFFITGSGRCGTTLLRRLLLSRTQVAIPPENYTLGLSRQAMEVAGGNWAGFCRLVLHGVRTYVTNWLDFAIDERRAMHLLTNMPSDRQSIPNFWHGFHALYATGLGKPSETRWGDKTPANVDRLDDIAAIFADAKFILMVRDAFDTAYSFGCMPTAARQGNFADGACRWANAGAKILSFMETHGLRAIVLRYEDLVECPDQTVRMVLRFLDLPESGTGTPTPHEASDMARQPHLRHVLDEVDRKDIGKGRRNLPDEVKQDIASIAAPLQVLLGYDPTGTRSFPLIDALPTWVGLPPAPSGP